MQIDVEVSALLQSKGAQVYSVTPETRVFDAIRLMADKNVGALVVLTEDRVVGVFSERDYTRKVALHGKSSKNIQVRELLSSPVISASPGTSVEECMRLMTTYRVRHLPILEGEKLAGVISIGDLVNWIISAQSTAINQLQNYIAGQYPG
ncbi:MAG: CBS domain-containing protein [Verrucomicrobia bacterium]|nr:CBS domain-containing protein [Verrucomicrobiota bacterium]